MLLRFSFLVLLSISVFAQVIGEVTLLKGNVFLLDEQGETVNELIETDTISTKDMISVAEKSVVRLKMKDGSVLTLGGNSQMSFDKYLIDDNKRESVLGLVKGKIRAEIKNLDGGEKPIKPEDKLFKINTSSVSIGVRGTEFLVNSYVVSKKPVADAVLLSGKINANVVGSTAVDLVPGQALNSSEFLASGKTRFLSKKSLAKLVSNKAAFMPNIQLPDGQFIDIDSKIKNIKAEPSNTPSKEATKQTTKEGGKQGTKQATKQAGKEASKTAAQNTTASSTTSTATTSATTTATTGVTTGVATPATTAPGFSPSAITTPGVPTVPGPSGLSIPKLPSISSKAGSLAPKGIVKEALKYITASPWDIRDALINRKELKKINECYYWIYEKKSGEQVMERFRKEKDCDEFEFDF